MPNEGASTRTGASAGAPSGYRGRFAPSPTGALHAGSLVAALASWLDARAHAKGRWLVRIEDLDRPRCVAGADAEILRQLAACGLQPDEPPLWQSTRRAAYDAAIETLAAAGKVYPCACSRHEVDAALAAAGAAPARFAERVYPGTCRPERGGLRGRPPRAWRLRVDAGAAAEVTWFDRRLGVQHQNVATAVGDFVVRRADGIVAYQLAVVVDDAAQRITDIVRGSDLADNTARQLVLQRALGLPTPRYLHTPLVLGPDGHKLSKQNGAKPLDVAAPLSVLAAAAQTLGLSVPPAATVAEWLAAAVLAWRVAYP